ncbi:MAG: DEAD/DEAH box helicase, partial [Clostridiales bacterium]|nr:DEAD/DEAH box helicase [Clostridiales bacterium]
MSAPDLTASQKTALVAVSAATFAIDKPYSYRVPGIFAEKALPGARIAAPFGRGNKKVEGIILSVSEESPDLRLKAIDSVLDDTPLLGDEQITLSLWMADRFFCTVFEALRAMLPAGLWYRGGKSPIRDKTVKYVSLAISPAEARELYERVSGRAPMQAAVLKLLEHGEAVSEGEVRYKTGASGATINALVKRGSLKAERREVFRRPDVDPLETHDLELTPQQDKAYELLRAKLNSGAAAALLHGVTGSGKTTVYIKLIGDALKSGRTAIVLVPEISLTPQLMSIFVSKFHDEVAVLHSALTVGERYDEWKRIKGGAVKVVIGTRSAVFAPLENIGLIVIDEEQEHTYKSESSPRYQARDVAKYRCAHYGAMLLLGSATPSVESMYNAQNGVYTLAKLPDRYNARALPDVLIADIKEDLRLGHGGS